MATNDSLLRQALSKYPYSELALKDILNVFPTFPGLRSALDIYVFNDGSCKELVCLEGSVPVVYQGNIPLCIWLMQTHPYNRPIVYVKPTATMQIRPGKNVDANGKVYIPYMHYWKYPKSTLLELIQMLTSVFGEEPPVCFQIREGAHVQPQGSGPSAKLLDLIECYGGLFISAFKCELHEVRSKIDYDEIKIYMEQWNILTKKQRQHLEEIQLSEKKVERICQDLQRRAAVEGVLFAKALQKSDQMHCLRMIFPNRAEVSAILDIDLDQCKKIRNEDLTCNTSLDDI